MGNLATLQPNVFSKDNQPEGRGRPKKFVSLLKAQGYKLSEINDCIKTMLSMTKEQLNEAIKNPQATALEMMIAAAIQVAIKKGDLSTMETLVSRTYGKPKETIEYKIAPEIEAARGLYGTLTEKGLQPKKALEKVIKGARLNGFELTEDDILNADTIG